MIAENPRPKFILYTTPPEGGPRRAWHASSAFSAKQLADAFRKVGHTIGDTVTIEQHELALCVQLLRPKPGDLVVLRHRGVDCDWKPALFDLAGRVAYETGSFVIVVPEGESLELLDEQTMRRAGWVRVEADTPLSVEAPA